MKKNKAEVLRYHQKLKGKISTLSKVTLRTLNNLSLFYTPGVAHIVKQIYKNQKSVYDLTIKNNTIAVVTDGSAVLGLGNVGPYAALPVMEGKCAIFKEFAGLNAFPICLATQKVDEIVETVKNISPVFAGINLEDISSPRCFTIESNLQKYLDIPVMHDDQHATAIAVLAGLINALKVVKKNFSSAKTVIVGAGAAGITITKLLSFYGMKNLIVVDSQGIINSQRSNLPQYKKGLLKISNFKNITGDLISAAKNADILIGVSKRGVFTKEVIMIMNNQSVVFALANPDPEVSSSDAKIWGVKVYACGRSDFPNQINNALVFPGFFKGLLQYKITKITDQMKINAAKRLASLIKKPTPENFIPSIFDKKVVSTIAGSLVSN